MTDALKKKIDVMLEAMTDKDLDYLEKAITMEQLVRSMKEKSPK